MKSWGDILTHIVEFYGAVRLINPPERYRLNRFTVLCDVRRTIDIELFTCRANDGKKAFVPDLKRLYKYKRSILKDFDYSVDINYLLKYGQ